VISRRPEGSLERRARSAARPDYIDIHGDVLRDLVTVLAAAEKLDEAREAAAGALELHERKGNVVSAGKARALIAALAAPAAT
jgi:hypothetical protein